nr:site-specific integrase [Alicyclobacillus ferrooxydans]
MTFYGYHSSERDTQEKYLPKCYAKKAGINNVRVSPHTFRHYFATKFLRNGGGPIALQHILGQLPEDLNGVQTGGVNVGDSFIVLERDINPQAVSFLCQCYRPGHKYNELESPVLTVLSYYPTFRRNNSTQKECCTWRSDVRTKHTSNSEFLICTQLTPWRK